MEITKEYLQEQIDISRKQRDQALADANAYSGAVQAFELMIERLAKEPDAPKSE